tara:strand:+ start:1371 stop:2567 length:1197 start_codon:yes stop_codon:yes gene_type:complete
VLKAHYLLSFEYLKVIHTIASTRLDHGGTSRSVPATCNALNASGVDTHLVTAEPADSSVTSNLPHDRSRVHLARESARVRQWGVPRQFRHRLASLTDDEQQGLIVHDHAVWLATNHAVASFCRERNVLRVVSPRGMLGEWAMAHGGFKKRLAWKLYQRRDLATADAFHATSSQEADEIRSLGFKQPIAVVPNGVTLPPGLPVRRTSEGRQALFLSRIHPKKGLIQLVRAWKQADVPKQWHLVIAGPDENGHQAEVQAEVRRLGIGDHVDFPGEIDNDAKWQSYVDSDLFILPSFNENFGIVIAEAMAAGLPVITTTATPWRVIRDQSMGWWIDPEVEPLVEAIDEALRLPTDELAAMGTRAAQFTRQQATWSAVAERLSDFYRWLLDGDHLPDTVRVD